MSNFSFCHNVFKSRLHFRNNISMPMDNHWILWKLLHFLYIIKFDYSIYDADLLSRIIWCKERNKNSQNIAKIKCKIKLEKMVMFHVLDHYLFSTECDVIILLGLVSSERIFFVSDSKNETISAAISSRKCDFKKWRLQGTQFD